MSKNPLTHFKTFPEFSTLGLADRDAYEEFIADFPPTIQYSFVALMMWWGVIDECKVAELNGNLVLSFWLPGDESMSGLAVLGKNDLDETICTVFDHQKAQGHLPRIVHMPDYLLKSVRFPDMFRFSSEPNMDEGIIDVEDFMSLDALPKHKRADLRRLMAVVDESSIEVVKLEIDNPSVKDMLLDLIEKWHTAGPLNNYGKYELEGLRRSIRNSDVLGLDCIGLYIKGRVHAFFIFERVNATHINLGYNRFSYEFPHIVDVAIYAYSKWLADDGVKTVNLDSDFGVDVLRSTKISLVPSNYRRMYTVEPRK